MKAIYFALQSFKDISNQSILIKTDNTTCVAYINHQGGITSPTLSRIAKQLWRLCLNRKIVLKAEHVLGINNVLADRASWLQHDRSDWKLDLAIFRLINQIWEPFQVDLFASRMNNQLTTFYSWLPDPFAAATDALRQNWSKLNAWANLP
jgi:hypothetical protein